MEMVQRRKKSKQSKERRNKRIRNFFLVAGGIFAAMLIFSYTFRVTEIKIAGNTRHSDEVILQYVREDWMTQNTTLISWFRKSMEVETIPFVESLDFEVLDKNTIRIYVNEKQIVGYVIDNEHKMFFDKDGYVLEIMPMTEEELQSIQQEQERLEQLRREEEGEEYVDEDYSDEEYSDEDYSNEDYSDEEDLEEYQEEISQATQADSVVLVEGPQVPWVVGLDILKMSEEGRLLVGDSKVFNTVQGIWRIASKYGIIPERVLFDEEYKITLVYQNAEILCQLGSDMILEEKMTRVAAILPNLTDKRGILHLEDYELGSQGIIFSKESEYTILSKINVFLQKKS